MYGTHLSPVLGNTEKHQTAVREYPEASGKTENEEKCHNSGQNGYEGWRELNGVRLIDWLRLALSQSRRRPGLERTLAGAIFTLSHGRGCE